MKTIEERAEAYVNSHNSLHFTRFLAYLKGATDEQKLMIDKVCEWLKNYDNEQLPYTDLDCDGHCYVDMVKLAEEFRKAMEGE